MRAYVVYQYQYGPTSLHASTRQRLEAGRVYSSNATEAALQLVRLAIPSYIGDGNDATALLDECGYVVDLCCHESEHFCPDCMGDMVDEADMMHEFACVRRGAQEGGRS